MKGLFNRLRWGESCVVGQRISLCVALNIWCKTVLKGWIAIALLRLLSAPRATQSGVVGEVIQSGLASPVGLQHEVGGCCSAWKLLLCRPYWYHRSTCAGRNINLSSHLFDALRCHVGAFLPSSDNNNKENTNATSAAGRMNTFNFYPSGGFASTFGDPSRSDRSPQGSWAVSRTDQTTEQMVLWRFQEEPASMKAT